MSDRQSLAEALDSFPFNWQSKEFKVISTAAQERLAQLPFGRVYPLETVERIAAAVCKARVGRRQGNELWQQVAVAVLDALNEGPA